MQRTLEVVLGAVSGRNKRVGSFAAFRGGKFVGRPPLRRLAHGFRRRSWSRNETLVADSCASTNSVLVVVHSSQNHFDKALGARQRTWVSVSGAEGKQSPAKLAIKNM